MAVVSSRRSRVMTSASMVDQFLQTRGIRNPKVLEAMRKIPRDRFVPEAFRERAYADHSLPIGDDQTISQPFTVATMTEALELTGTEKVLEIGTGSGYQAAVLAELTRSVFSIERIHRLASRARRNLEALGYHRVSVRVANGLYGWAEYAPFDRIVVTAVCREFPFILAEQLIEGGKLVLPLAEEEKIQRLYVMTKRGKQWGKKFLCECSFVPFVV
ncbi:MAG TPA: protein-L-isoaspartate(D-aspartate) O-methyltransferase [Bdellovibrionota bacterium]|nr:protein-L-isoaspartate(D-aspartate) O-methyltransferase [Bdellovibrionota bacterium]